MPADSLLNWEANARSPLVRYLPRIVAFLGYNPFPVPETLGEQLVAAIDDFRFENRMPSRAAAIRELIRRGLAAQEEKE